MGRKHTEETKKKISQSEKGKKISDETLIKMSIAQKGKKLTDEAKRKIGEANKGKHVSEETRRRIADSWKHRKPMSDDTKTKLRLAHHDRMEKILGQLSPIYNPRGCEYFNRLMEQTGTFIQHAQNGGEFYIKELGYWVDGYDKENNIVYEWDEPRHFNRDGKLKEKDIIRQDKITQFLGCKFIRIEERRSSNSLTTASCVWF